MKLHDATADDVPRISSVHVGTAEPSEMTRLLTEPHAVLREVGLNVAASATPSPIMIVPTTNAKPSAIVVLPRIDDDGHIDWVTVVMIDGDVIEEIHAQHHIQ